MESDPPPPSTAPPPSSRRSLSLRASVDGGDDGPELPPGVKPAPPDEAPPPPPPAADELPPPPPPPSDPARASTAGAPPAGGLDAADAWWVVDVDGRCVGPLSAADVRSLSHLGRLAATGWAWASICDGWTAVGALLDESDAPQTPVAAARISAAEFELDSTPPGFRSAGEGDDDDGAAAERAAVVVQSAQRGRVARGSPPLRRDRSSGSGSGSGTPRSRTGSLLAPEELVAADATLGGTDAGRALLAELMAFADEAEEEEEEEERRRRRGR